MIAVGIDVSKSKSTVAILNPDGSIRAKPFNIRHTRDALTELKHNLEGAGDDVRILMEYTGHYHYPVLKELSDSTFIVYLVNPYLIKKQGDTELHHAKTDKKDSLQLARYCFEKSYQLTPYKAMDQKYTDLHFLSRQYYDRIHYLSHFKTTLVNLLDETMPGLQKVIEPNTQNPDNSLYLEFIRKYRSYEHIHKMGQKRFLNSYSKFTAERWPRCQSKGLLLFELAENGISTRTDDLYTAQALEQCIDLVIQTQKAANETINQMKMLAETIPEYKILRAMFGVGDRLGPIIIAEIGDIRRFHSSRALNAYAGNDAPPYQSGQFESRNRHISKRGNPALRMACYQVMKSILLHQPQDDPIYLFMRKKLDEGKHPNVARMAGVNKFLRIYYARCMELYK